MTPKPAYEELKKLVKGKTMEARFGLEKKAENRWVVRLRTPAK